MILQRDKLYRARDGSIWCVVCTDYNDKKETDADLLKEYREPREWTIRIFDNGNISDENVAFSNDSKIFETVRVREVGYDV